MMKPRVCLHMIIRDEADVIERCLRSILPHIDAAIVVDTGSIDDTREIATEILFRRTPLVGGVYSLPWKGFAGSRNDGLVLAREICAKRDGVLRGMIADAGDRHDADTCNRLDAELERPWLLFTLDADEALVTDPSFQWPTDPFDAWHVQVKLGPNTFTRRLLTRASTPWAYAGVRHEDLVDEQGRLIGPPIRGAYVESMRDGARAKDPARFAKDAIALIDEELSAPADEPIENKARRYFYIANSLHDGYREVQDRANIEHALEWYTLCAQTPGDPGEKWACMHVRAGCMIELGKSPNEIVEAHLLAIAQHEPRAETLLQLARWMRATSTPGAAAIFEQAAARIPRPTHGMFVDDSCYPRAPRIGIISAPRDGGQFPLPVTITTAIATDHLVSPECIRVFYDSTGTLKLPGNVGWENTTQAVLDRIKQGGIWGTLNLCRALEWAAGADDLCCVLEDDVLFAREWMQRAKALLEAAEREMKGPVLINLHHMYGDLEGVLDDTKIAVGADRLLAAGSRAFPNGSQGLVCRPATAMCLASELAERMDAATLDERKDWAMDVGLFRCCHELGVARMLYTHPCLLWHQNEVKSTWASKDPRWLGRDDEHRLLRQTKHFRPW